MTEKPAARENKEPPFLTVGELKVELNGGAGITGGVSGYSLSSISTTSQRLTRMCAHPKFLSASRWQQATISSWLRNENHDLCAICWSPLKALMEKVAARGSRKAES